MRHPKGRPRSFTCPPREQYRRIQPAAHLRCPGGPNITATYVQRLRRLSRNARLSLIVSATVGFCRFGITAVLLNLYLVRLGYGPEFIGVFNGFARLVNTAACLPAGALGARFGSRRAMIVGVMLSTLGSALLVLVELLPTPLWAGWLLMTNAVIYLGGALWGVNVSPFFMGATTDENRGYAFSVQMALIPLAGFAGSLAGGFLPGLLVPTFGLSLDGPAPYRYPLLIAAAVYGFIGMPALIAARDPPVDRARQAESGSKAAPYGLISVIALITVLRMSGYWAVTIFFNVYMDTRLHASTSLIGTLSAVGQLIAVPAALAAPLVLNRLGQMRTFVWGMLGVFLTLIPLALVPSWGAAGLSFAALLASAWLVAPAFSIFSQEIVESRFRALMSRVVQASYGLSSALVSFGGGIIIATLGYRWMFLIAAGLTGAGTLLFWAYFRRRDRL